MVLKTSYLIIIIKKTLISECNIYVLNVLSKSKIIAIKKNSWSHEVNKFDVLKNNNKKTMFKNSQAKFNNERDEKKNQLTVS